MKPLAAAIKKDAALPPSSTMALLFALPFLLFTGTHCEMIRRIELQDSERLDVPMKLAKIIGGKPARDGRFTFAQISLQLPKDEDDNEAHQCMGSLIASDMVLTAAHCETWFDSVHYDRYEFENPSDSYLTIAVENTMVHPYYEAEKFRYDFAVVKLSKAIPNPSPVRLNSKASWPLDGDELSVLGWGATDLTSPLGTVYPYKLQKGSVNYLTNEECANTVVGLQNLYRNDIFDEMMCALGDGVDACSGDSGGPLIVEGMYEGLDLQVGLVSWGRGCAQYPGVYSRISAGYEWIREQVCYQSEDPPPYMGCLDSERHPKFIGNFKLFQDVPSPTPGPTHDALPRRDNNIPAKPLLHEKSPQSAPALPTNPKDTLPFYEDKTEDSSVRLPAKKVCWVALLTLAAWLYY